MKSILFLCFITGCHHQTPPVAALSTWSPDNQVKINRFSDAYNKYISDLQAGRRDIKKWREVEKQWLIISRPY